MGMSTIAVGYMKKDDIWEKMQAVWDSCIEAGIPIPTEVDQFFDGEDPKDMPGMEVSLGDSCKKFSDEYSDGFEISIDDLPKNVRYIRVYNSW